jgi:hypothetical protein
VTVRSPQTEPTGTASRESAGRHANGNRPDRARALITAALVGAPDRLVMAIVCLSVVISVSMVAGYFSPPLVLAATAVLIVATWRLAPRAYRRDDHAALGSAVALLLALAWFLLNRHYFGQLLSVARDPSVYTLRGWWLMHHHSPNIAIGSAAHAVTNVPGAAVDAGGFPRAGDDLKAQGTTLLPGLLGLTGWLGGQHALLQANVAIGSAGLLAVYGFARRMVGPVWALVPMISLGACIPMVYFSRAEYTEPVAMLFVFGGLTMLWSAATERTRASLWRFGFAGLTIGASQIARIDGLVAVVGACVGIGAVSILARDKGRRSHGRLALIAFVVGAAITVGLGTIDLKVNSPVYFSAEESRTNPLFFLAVAAVLGLLVLSALPLSSLRAVLAARAPVVGRMLGVLGVVVVVVLVSRPLWWKGHFIQEAPIRTSITHYQQREGLPIDGSRSYDEQTIRWLSWYLGWPLVLIAAAGLIWLLARAARTRDLRLVCFLGVFGTVAALYLNDVSITPIQVWAMRRFLPVVLPGLLIAATWLCVQLVRRWPPTLWLAGVVAAGICASPLLFWNSLVTVGEQQGEYDEVASACQAIHSGRVVVSGIPASGYYLPSTRIVCGAESVYLGDPNAAALAKIRRDWGGGPVDLVSFHAQGVAWTSPPNAIHSGSYPSWPSLIHARPSAAQYENRVLYAGTIQPDGSVTPTQPQP